MEIGEETRGKNSIAKSVFANSERVPSVSRSDLSLNTVSTGKECSSISKEDLKVNIEMERVEAPEDCSSIPEEDRLVNDEKDSSEASEKELAITDEDYGCAHYKRKSKFVTPCCNKVYTCRFCHDEEEAHTVNRKEVTELICVLCDTRQPVQATCQYCHCRFGKYTCLECNLFDDEDRNQYHCDGCGICRVGGREKFFHCAVCNMCLPLQLQNGHKCVENVSHANCPVCLEDIHTSRIPCYIPNCGHLLHRPCFEELLRSGYYACPTCQVSLLDMSDLWSFLDKEVFEMPMPWRYRECKADILCKDCHEESTVQFHVVGLKCLNCGSYNTCRVRGSLSPPPDPRDEAADENSTEDEEHPQPQN
ncbi:RING finger and CHY zinc finger domain-containing protein 1 [Prorops nasuta]|uniref:RING finger and CHY zinc finger domain-containing protein 1 n=1 Tax=Prorops nasuta TaxID=863751 RepID=UPI0034CDF0D1